jgi:hypothetical protein
MISHSINYGRFLHWLVESGNVDLLYETLTIYREIISVSFFLNLYYSFIWLALLSGVIFIVLAFLMKRENFCDNRRVIVSLGRYNLFRL